MGLNIALGIRLHLTDKVGKNSYQEVSLFSQSRSPSK